MALNMIAKLYAIEKQLTDLTPEEIVQTRQAKSNPILQQLKKWLDKEIRHVPPKTHLGKAMHFTV